MCCVPGTGTLTGTKISSTEGTCQEIAEMTKSVAGGEGTGGSMQDQETKENKKTEGRLFFAAVNWIRLLFTPQSK